MSDKKIDELQELSEKEEKTGVVGLVSDATDDGELRFKTIAGFAESLHRENAMENTWESTTLWEDYSSPHQFSTSGEVNLDYVSGNSGPRQSFDDGYTYFVFHINTNSSNADSSDDVHVTVDAIRVIVSSGDNMVTLGADDHHRIRFFRETDTSFQTNVGGGGAVLYLTKIVGYKQIIRPSSL